MNKTVCVFIKKVCGYEQKRQKQYDSMNKSAFADVRKKPLKVRYYRTFLLGVTSLRLCSLQ